MKVQNQTKVVINHNFPLNPHCGFTQHSWTKDRSKSAGMYCRCSSCMLQPFMTTRLQHPNPTEQWLGSQCVLVIASGYLKQYVAIKLKRRCMQSFRMWLRCMSVWIGQLLDFHSILLAYETTYWAFPNNTLPGNWHSLHHHHWWSFPHPNLGRTLFWKITLWAIHKKSEFLQTCCLFSGNLSSLM